MALEVIALPSYGAEDVAVAPDGTTYCGTEDGSLYRVVGSSVEKFADTGGRPCGIEIAPDGRLLVCDATRGLLRVDPASGSVEVVVAEIAGVPMRFCNNAAIASDGTIWFTDSSRFWSIDRWIRDFLTYTRSGRLIRVDPDGTVTVVIDGLAFANGVVIASDGSFVAVAETAERTIVRLWLTGDRAGEQDFLVPDLPGYVDNLATGSDGLIWVAIPGSRRKVVDLIHRLPRPVRRFLAALPQWMQPPNPREVRVQAYDEAGTLVHDIDLPGDEFHMVTGVREHGGRLWMSSIEESALAVHTL